MTTESTAIPQTPAKQQQDAAVAAAATTAATAGATGATGAISEAANESTTLEIAQGQNTNAAPSSAPEPIITSTSAPSVTSESIVVSQPSATAQDATPSAPLSSHIEPEPKEEQREVLLTLKDLCKYFEVKSGFLNRKTNYLKAVDHLSLNIYKGECFGLVGESGCGKTTLGKMIAGLYKPTSGEIIYNGVNLGGLTRNERRKYSRDIQMIFQDPYSSLNPRMTVEEIISEPMIVNKTHRGAAIGQRVEYLLNCVGLAKQYKARYPHEFSGGQRQRIGIARALAVAPRLIVCDEAVSALDVSIQAQILNLLDDLKAEFGLTYLFIAHGLAAVKHISDRIGVMYLGSMVEVAPKEAIYDNPLHPYTKSLISAIPIIDPNKRKERILLKGDLPSPIDPPMGCRFNTRCFIEDCAYKHEQQALVPRQKHLIACTHVSEQLAGLDQNSTTVISTTMADTTAASTNVTDATTDHNVAV